MNTQLRPTSIVLACLIAARSPAAAKRIPLPRHRAARMHPSCASTDRAPSFRSPKRSPRSSRAEERGAIRVTAGLSGTGGGFKKLCRGDADISNASRPILTRRDGGLSRGRHPLLRAADRVRCDHRRREPGQPLGHVAAPRRPEKIWEPAAQAQIVRWNQVRPEWPDTPLMLFGPGADSGTFDYFTEAIVGKAKSSRGDYTASEDDNVLVQGVEHNKNALGYFGFAYYVSHKDRMRAVPIETAERSGRAEHRVGDRRHLSAVGSAAVHLRERSGGAAAGSAQVRGVLLDRGPALAARGRIRPAARAGSADRAQALPRKPPRHACSAASPKSA